MAAVADNFSRRIFTHILLGFSLALFGSAAHEGLAQDQAPKLLDVLSCDEIFTANNKRPYIGIYNEQGGVTCASCHEQDEPRRQAWAFQNEVNVWKEHGKHKDAYIALQGKLSQQIGERLGLKPGEIHRDKRCLTCHVGMPAHSLEPVDQPLISEAFAKKPILQDGVSCESCHGAAGSNDGQPGWRYIHTDGVENSKWRYKSAQDKLSFGYYDVRSLRHRTKLCVSCHVGNVDQGKVVTHDMFAAGHPPLPGFETVMFISQQPRHWRRLSEKDPVVRDAYLKAKGPPALKENDLVAARELLISALIAASESLKLTADLADADKPLPSPLPKKAWPELAQFACYNCHHDLKQDSWRRKRGFRLYPGRPDLHEWPNVLTEVALQTAGEQAPLDESLSPLIDELNRRPFGRASHVPVEARKTAAWLDEVALQLERKTLARGDGKAILALLAKRAGNREVELLDYDAARQLVWAYDVVYRELAKAPLAVAETRAWYRDAEQKRLPNLDVVESQLAAFDERLLLDLRSPQDPLHSFRRIAEYDAAEFQTRFASLHAAIENLREKLASAKR